jgi:hypothetical protein
MLCALSACNASVTKGPEAGSGGSGQSSGGSSGSAAGNHADSGKGGSGSGGSGSADGGSSAAANGGKGGQGGSAGSSGSSGSSGMGGSGGRGGSGGSAGSKADAGMPDAGPPPGATCDEGTYILCEDFEGTANGAVPSGWTKHGDPVSVADDQAASGTRSLKIGPTDNGERRIWHDAKTIPTTHWGRVRYKVKLPVPDAFVHSTIVTFSGKSPKPDMLNLEVRVVDTVKESKEGWNNDGNGSHYQVLYNVQPQGRDEFGHGSSYNWKFDDQWHCAEWYIDSAQQAYKFFLDGIEIKEVEFSNGAGKYDDSEVPKQWDEIRLGWNNYQSAPPGFTAWIDDFALATQRIPCE